MKHTAAPAQKKQEAVGSRNNETPELKFEALNEQQLCGSCAVVWSNARRSRAHMERLS
jgi:hypothetical protein